MKEHLLIANGAIYASLNAARTHVPDNLTDMIYCKEGDVGVIKLASRFVLTSDAGQIQINFKH